MTAAAEEISPAADAAIRKLKELFSDPAIAAQAPPARSIIRAKPAGVQHYIEHVQYHDTMNHGGLLNDGENELGQGSKRKSNPSIRV
jgi:hypothetical protein